MTPIFADASTEKTPAETQGRGDTKEKFVPTGVLCSYFQGIHL